MSTSLTGTAPAMSASDLAQTYAANRQTCHVHVCSFEADGDLFLEQQVTGDRKQEIINVRTLMISCFLFPAACDLFF